MYNSIKYFINFLLVLFFLSPLYSTSKSSICILINSQELIEDEIISIENRLSNYAINAGKYRVIERRALRSIFQEQEFQLSNYVDNNTIDTLGGILGVSQILIGDISVTNNMYNINLKIDDVETGEVITSLNRLVKLDYISLLNMLPDISRELFGEIKNNNMHSIPIRSFRINQSQCMLADINDLSIPG